MSHGETLITLFYRLLNVAVYVLVHRKCAHARLRVLRVGNMTTQVESYQYVHIMFQVINKMHVYIPNLQPNKLINVYEN
jgi:hypothetical protein